MMGQFLTIWQPLFYLLSDAAVGASDALIPSASGGDFQFEFSGTLNWAMKLLRPAMKSWESVDSKNGINFYDRTIFDHLAAIFLTAVRRRRRRGGGGGDVTRPGKATRPWGGGDAAPNFELFCLIIAKLSFQINTL